MTQSVMASDTLFLPKEIIRNILMRLPVKSLLRSRCVCKDWRNLIKTPYFIPDQLHPSTHQNPSFLFQWNGLCLLDCKMQFHKVSEVPLIDSSNTTPSIIGSSNDLLCLYAYRYHTFAPDIFLWNPATREFRQVPPNTKCVDLRFEIGFGFGSPIVNDYNIVLTHMSNHEVTHVEMYSLRSGSGKEVEFGIENVDLFSHQITVNGAIFWFGYRWKLDTVYDVIVSFDIANEVFSLIPTPGGLAPTSTSRFAVYENKLAMLSFSPIQDFESLIKLWVMEDGTDTSWVKKHAGWNHELEIALLNISTTELKMFDINECGSAIGSGFKLQYADSLYPIFG